MLIGPKERIVFFGDSLTKRTGRMDSEIPADRYAVSYVESYVDLLVKRLLIHFPQLEFTIYNRGVGGDTVLNLLERYQKDVLPLKPTLMFLWIGQNDAKTLTTAASKREYPACWNGAGRTTSAWCCFRPLRIGTSTRWFSWSVPTRFFCL